MGTEKRVASSVEAHLAVYLSKNSNVKNYRVQFNRVPEINRIPLPLKTSPEIPKHLSRHGAMDRIKRFVKHFQFIDDGLSEYLIN